MQNPQERCWSEKILPQKPVGVSQGKPETSARR